MAKPKIFISYARPDEAELKRLLGHLKGIDGIDVWVDNKELEGGDAWEEKIRAAIDEANLSILFITMDFLKSEFINDIEVPQVLARDKMIVYPVIAKHSNWEQKSWLVKGKSVYLRSFNVRPVGANPIWPDQGFADMHLKQIAAEAARKAKEAKEAKKAKDGEGDDPLLVVLRKFDLHMSRQLKLAALDDDGRLCLSDGETVDVLHVSQAEPLDYWVLERPWKSCLEGCWRQGIVYSDWDGSLYNKNNVLDDSRVYAARDDDVPIHRFAVSPEGNLVTASWNGVLRRWDAQGQPLPAPTEPAPFLPTHLVPLPGNALIVVDQGNWLRHFDASQKQVWKWQPKEGRIQRVVPARDHGKPILLVQVGPTRLIRLALGGGAEQEIKFDWPIVAWSHRPGSGAGDPDWSVVASERPGEGAVPQFQIDWVNTTPLRRDAARQATVPFAVADIRPIRDPQHPTSFRAVGLTGERGLFTAVGRDHEQHPCTEKFHRLLVDRSGRFLYLHTGERLWVVRNPCMTSASCKAHVQSVEGVLKKNAYMPVTVRIENKGIFPLKVVEAELHLDGKIDGRPTATPPANAAPPGGTIDLTFSVCAQFVGVAVPLNLTLGLEDEGGPPRTTQDLRFPINSTD